MAAEDYFPFDDGEEEEGWGYKAPPRCKRCRKLCEWVMTGAGWRLFNVSGGPHNCAVTASPNDFDDVSEEAAPPPPLV
jgi:hypothetical protein